MPKVRKITSTQYHKKEVCYEFEFLHADKRLSSQQIDIIFFDVFGQACQKYPGKFTVSLWYLKKEIRTELDFL